MYTARFNQTSPKRYCHTRNRNLTDRNPYETAQIIIRRIRIVHIRLGITIAIEIVLVYFLIVVL